MSNKNWMSTLGWSKEHTAELRNAAYAYIRQGKYDISLPLFEALVVLDPTIPYDWQMLGALYVQTDQPEKAIKAIDKALLEEADHGPTLLNLTKAFFMAGKFEDGRRLAKILEKDKDPYVAGQAAALLLSYG